MGQDQVQGSKPKKVLNTGKNQKIDELADKSTTRDMEIMDNVLHAQKETNKQLDGLTHEIRLMRKEMKEDRKDVHTLFQMMVEN